MSFNAPVSNAGEDIFESVTSCSDLNISILVDGSNKINTDFGEFKNGVWKPIEYSGSFGTDGFHLKFAAGAIGTDSSGNGNTFSTNGLTDTNVVLDSPTFGS